tara:strand:+ start:394 stop:792 length:399 start_codon:yes stop_codon:yes gene_type:complete
MITFQMNSVRMSSEEHQFVTRHYAWRGLPTEHSDTETTELLIKIYKGCGKTQEELQYILNVVFMCCEGGSWERCQDLEEWSYEDMYNHYIKWLKVVEDFKIAKVRLYKARPRSCGQLGSYLYTHSTGKISKL